MNRYYSSLLNENPQIALLDSLISSTFKPVFYKISEKFDKSDDLSDHPAYFKMKYAAKNQYFYWLDQVRKPHFGENFGTNFVETPIHIPIPENPDWYNVLGDLVFNIPNRWSNRDYSVSPLYDSTKAKELLAAFAFVGFDVLLETIPSKNFIWACYTLSFIEDARASSYMSAFLDYLPILLKWQKDISSPLQPDHRLDDYENAHHKLSKLHSKMGELRSYLASLPDPSNRKLRKQRRRLMQKEKKFKQRAAKLVARFEPILAGKLQFEEEEELKQKTSDFIAFAWKQFHEVVTWTFPHCFVQDGVTSASMNV